MNVSVFLRAGAALALVAGLLGAGCGGSGGSVEKPAAPTPPPVAAAPAQPVVAARYVVTNLGSTTYYYRSTNPIVVINNAGQVAVNLDNGDGSVLRSGGELFKIPPLRSDRKEGWALVSAINDAGQMVGSSERGGGGFGPYLWDTTGLRALEMLPGSQSSFPTGMNNRGQIVGVAGVLPRSRTSPVILDDHVVLWETSGAMPRDLGLGKAVAINDQGAVIGSDLNYQGRAVVWRDGAKSVLPSLAGREPSGDDTVARAINAQGQIAGSARTTEPSKIDIHAVVWENEQIRDLGTLGPGGSHAHGINDLGQVVGSSDIGPGAPRETAYLALDRAFLYTDGQMIDLNTRLDPASGWVLKAAYGINRQGEIVGMGTRNGQDRTFLLTPAP